MLQAIRHSSYVVALVLTQATFAHTVQKTPQDLLSFWGISPTERNSVTKESIESAYRRMAREYHPDKVKSEDKSKTTEKFQAIGELKDALVDNEALLAIYLLPENPFFNEPYFFTILGLDPQCLEILGFAGPKEPLEIDKIQDFMAALHGLYVLQGINKEIRKLGERAPEFEAAILKQQEFFHEIDKNGMPEFHRQIKEGFPRHVIRSLRKFTELECEIMATAIDDSDWTRQEKKEFRKELAVRKKLHIKVDPKQNSNVFVRVATGIRDRFRRLFNRHIKIDRSVLTPPAVATAAIPADYQLADKP